MAQIQPANEIWGSSIELDAVAGPMRRVRRGWKVWVAPRPFTLVSTGVYAAALIMLLQGNCVGCRPTWAGALVGAALVALLLLDRLDYLLYGETPPVKAGLVLMGARLALTAFVAVMFGFAGGALNAFLFALLPYLALFYFGLRGSMITGSVVWVATVALMAVAAIPRLTVVNVVSKGQTSSYYILTPSTVYEYIGWVTLCTILFVFVLTSARVTHREKEHAARAGRLLARLDASHAWLNHYAQKTIAETEERNRAANEMHDRLGHHLAAVSIQLEKAVAFRDVDPPGVEQALRSARQTVSRALADVRRSVASLRERTRTADEPAQGLPRTDMDWWEQEADAEREKGPKRWLRWLAPRSYDPFATAAYLGVILLDISSVQDGGVGRALGVAAMVLLLVALERLEYAFFGERTPTPVGVLLLVVRIGVVVALMFGLGVWNAILLVAFLPYLFFIYLGDRAGYAAGAAVLALSIMALISWGQDWSRRPLEHALLDSAQTLLIIVFILAVMAVTARVVRKEREGRTRTEQLLAEVGEAHSRLAEASRQSVAAVEARNSLARDIHDGLGHYLTAAGLQLEKAIAFRSIDPGAADQAIDDSKRMVSEALREIRGTVGSLKETQDMPPLAQMLAELVQRATHRGLEITLHVEGDEQGYSRQALTALYRAAQEGLTNVQRHSQARHAVLALVLGEQEATLEIEDNGVGFTPGGLPDQPTGSNGKARKRGYGLQSMVERLELVGGALEVESREGWGTRLHIAVPKHHGAHGIPEHKAAAQGVN